MPMHPTLAFPLLALLSLQQGLPRPWAPVRTDAVPSSQLRIVNSGQPGSALSRQGDQLAQLVLEFGQGNADLNADGDASDTVLFVQDLSTGTTTNTGLAVADARFVARGLLALSRSENDQNDWNGDGDQTDDVLFLFDLDRGTLHNLGRQGWQVLVGSDSFVTRTFESLDGSDWNGDGDQQDIVLSVFAPKSLRGIGGPAPLGARSLRPPLSGLTVKSSFFSFGFADPALVYGVDEASSGNRDLNGDGDATDEDVLHLLELERGAVHNVGVDGTDLLVRGSKAVFRVCEQPGRDLNEDGDVGDSVLHVLDTKTRALSNLGLASQDVLYLGQTVVAFRVPEAGQAVTDLNGDGDQVDDVLFVHDFATGTTTNLGLAVESVGGAGSHLVALVSEAESGTDWNGDGDTNDSVYQAYDLTTKAWTNLGQAGIWPPLGGDRYVLLVLWELAQGVDHTGDGDILDFVMAIYDTHDGTLTNTGKGLEDLVDMLSYEHVEIGPFCAFPADEQNSNADWTGDGIAFSTVVFFWDGDSKAEINTGLAALAASRRDQAVTIRARELFAQTDYNGDGDLLDFVDHVVLLD